MNLFAVLLSVYPGQPIPDTPEAVVEYTQTELYELINRHEALSAEQRIVKARLSEMVAVDQRGRGILSEVDNSGVDSVTRAEMRSGVWSVLTPIDEAHEADLEALMKIHGWFPIGVWGEDAARDAWLIAQHASLDLQKRVLKIMALLVETGDADGSHFALMYDRVALKEGRLQRYSRQVRCVDGEIVPDEIEDPDNVAQRRAEAGLIPLSEYLELFTASCA